MAIHFLLQLLLFPSVINFLLFLIIILCLNYSMQNCSGFIFSQRFGSSDGCVWIVVQLALGFSPLLLSDGVEPCGVPTWAHVKSKVELYPLELKRLAGYCPHRPLRWRAALRAPPGLFKRPFRPHQSPPTLPAKDQEQLSLDGTLV